MFPFIKGISMQTRTNTLPTMQTKTTTILTQLNLLRRAGWRALLLLGLTLSAGLAQADTISVTNNTSGSWTCPAGVTSVTVEMWGGGGGGGGTASGQPAGTYGTAGGGGGGAYTMATVSVTPTTSYSFTVGGGGKGGSNSGGNGAPGTNTTSTFPGTTTANGGLGGGGWVAGSATNGPGGTVTGIGNHNGGNGAAGVNQSYSGGGGGSGSASADGGNAGGATAGTAGSGGGAGGLGKTTADVGGPGNAPGGGGGGAFSTLSAGNQKGGGAGAAGRIVVTFTTVLTASSLSVSGFPNPAAQGASGSVTVAAKGSNGITVPSYTGTVTLASSDGAATLPASHTFVSGDNGVFTFTGVALNTLGTWSITATDNSTPTPLTGSQTGIQVVPPSSSFYWTNSVSGNWSVAANWNNDLGAGVAPMAAGQTNYALNFNQTGTYTATNDLNSSFLLNQLNFGGGTVTLRGNSLAFTNDGGTGPAINQNSPNKLTIANNLAFNSSLTLGGSGGGAITLSGVISGAGSLTMNNSAGASVAFNANNSSTWTGPLVVNSGTFNSGGPTCLGVNNTVQLNSGATFSMQTYNSTIGGLNDNADSGGTVVCPASQDKLLTLGGSGVYSFAGTIAPATASRIALIKSGNGTQTLSGVNTYAGDTTISGGTLALSGSGSIANSASIVVASNAVFDISGLSSAFALASALANQTLSNSAPGAIINGTNDCSAGTLSLVLDGVNPAFTIANGGMTLSALTTINIYNNNTNMQLAANTSYKLIAKGTAGLVAGAVTANPMTVGGIGAAGTATLAITGQELYLNVGESLLPGTGTNIVFNFTGGNTLTLSWPTNYVGWALQSNAVSLTSASDWHLVPGSTTNSSMSFPADTAEPNVFYRMHLP